MGPSILQREGCHLGAAVVSGLVRRVRDRGQKTVVNCRQTIVKNMCTMKELLSQIDIYFVAQSKEFNLITKIVLIKTRPFKIRCTVYVYVWN